MKRRGFLGAVLAAVAAPFVAKAEPAARERVGVKHQPEFSPVEHAYAIHGEMLPYLDHEQQIALLKDQVEIMQAVNRSRLTRMDLLERSLKLKS